MVRKVLIHAVTALVGVYAGAWYMTYRFETQFSDAAMDFVCDECCEE